MRKLGKKNKISFVIFTFIVILVVAIFVYGINRVLSYEKEEYELTTGSVLYDEDNNFLSLNSASFMSRNWNGKYYVTLEDETSYNLGEETVVFNSNDYRMYLYGTFYQVFENGKVEKHVGQTEVVRNTEAKVYKLKDRKYLIVASKIATEDLSVNTANYLIIEIDKIGNALLMNNEINIKTIVPTVLKTDDFNFDIANEKLVFGKTYIDLKKINGSTNEYVEPVKKPTTNNNSGGSTGGTGGTGGAGGAGGTGSIIYGNTSNSNKIELVKKVGLNSIVPYSTYLDVDYTVIDLNNEYNSVYLLIDDGVNKNKIELNKESSNYKVRNLKPNYEYNVSLGYTYTDKSDGFNTEMDEISDVFKIKTAKLEQKLEITKINKANKQIHFNLKLDDNYMLETVSIALYSDSIFIQSISLSQDDIRIATTDSGFSAYITYENLGTQNILKVENAIYNGENANIDLSTVYVNS
ncbi:MAG: hypothetical protein E7169_03860 [Firmicutes bacterium]|nr:hypothetical protein [Bacillota bacterium]